MELTTMRYKDYVWPHNPATYSIDFARDVAALKAAGGGCFLQDMGMRYRVMRGEGEFVGANAYDEFKRLATVFYEGGAGRLIHPVWQTANAHFVTLRLLQKPFVDYVQYGFEFREAQGYFEKDFKTLWSAQEDGEMTGAEEGEAVAEVFYHTVRSGDTLWAIAQQYGTALSELLAKNPQIRNPNLIYPGERVRVR